MDGKKAEFKKQRYNNFYMNVAELVSQMSYANKLKVGSILVKNDNIISFGWNGMPAGYDNNCEDIIDTGEMPPEMITKSEVLHAEQNCLMKIAKSTNSSEQATMFITHAPCMECAKLIYQSGIKSVYYRNQYRSNNGILFLDKCDIEVNKI